MNVTSENRAEFRFTGWHMLACMIAFFGTIIAVNLTMAMLASGSWTGLVVKNSYVASQHYNEKLQAAKLQTEHGLRSDISYSEGTLSFRISYWGGTSLNPRDAVVWIGRPTFEQQDRTLAAICNSSGNCAVEIDLSEGLWALRIQATVLNRTYRRDVRLSVGATGKVKVE